MMKNILKKKLNIISLLLLVAAMPIKTNGQAALLVLLFGDKVASENFYFSMKVGANISNLTSTDKSTSNFGINFGLLGNIKLSDKFYLVPEFSPLSKKGAKNILVGPTGNADLDALLSGTETSEIQLNYLDIPVILKYYPIETFNIGIGPYFSFLTSGDNFYEFNADEVGDLKIYNDVKSDINKYDYGIMVEAAYAPWRKGSFDEINFHARFSYGLADIIENNQGNSVQNYALQLFVSIPFIKTD